MSTTGLRVERRTSELMKSGSRCLYTDRAGGRGPGRSIGKRVSPTPAAHCIYLTATMIMSTGFPPVFLDSCFTPRPMNWTSRRAHVASAAEGLRAAEDLAVEDGVPGIGMRRPSTPSFGDLAELFLGRQAFGDGLTGDRGISHSVGPHPSPPRAVCWRGEAPH